MLYLWIALIVTALFQVSGAVLTYFLAKRFERQHDAILMAEIMIMILISLEIIFFSSGKSMYSFYGVAAGALFIFLVNRFIPHKHIDKFQRLSGLVFIAMCIHEFPEGVAFGSAYLLDPKMGILTAAFIAIHNIPEGSIVALPYILKKKVRQAFALTMITQGLYILGGFGAYIFLLSMSTAAQATSACFAAGAMLFIAFEELKFLNSNY